MSHSEKFFPREATPEGILEVNVSYLTPKEVEELKAAWVAAYGGTPTFAQIVSKQRRVVSVLQDRLIRDVGARDAVGSARGSGELKDVSLALAAAVDKLHTLYDAGKLYPYQTE